MYIGDWPTARSIATDMIGARETGGWDHLRESWDDVEFPSVAKIIEAVDEAKQEDKEAWIDEVARWVIRNDAIETTNEEYTVDQNLSRQNRLRSLANDLLQASEHPEAFRSVLTTVKVDVDSVAGRVLREKEEIEDNEDRLVALNSISSWLKSNPDVYREIQKIDMEKAKRGEKLTPDPGDVVPQRPHEIDPQTWEELCKMALESFNNFAHHQSNYGNIQNKYDFPAPRRDDMMQKVINLKAQESDIEETVRKLAMYIYDYDPNSEDTYQLMGWNRQHS